METRNIREIGRVRSSRLQKSTNHSRSFPPASTAIGQSARPAICLPHSASRADRTLQKFTSIRLLLPGFLRARRARIREYASAPFARSPRNQVWGINCALPGTSRRRLAFLRVSERPNGGAGERVNERTNGRTRLPEQPRPREKIPPGLTCTSANGRQDRRSRGPEESRRRPARRRRDRVPPAGEDSLLLLFILFSALIRAISDIRRERRSRREALRAS